MKASNRRRRHRRNPMVKVYNRRRRHNPSINKAYIETIGGSLLGFAVVRALPAMIPTSITGLIPPSSFTPAIVSGLATAIASWAAQKFGNSNIAQGVAIAGGALTASQMLNALGAPSQVGGFNFGVSGVGDIVATQGFTVPDRSVRAQVIPMASGVGRYGQGSYRRLAS